jgi:hypothetical protein
MSDSMLRETIYVNTLRRRMRTKAKQVSLVPGSARRRHPNSTASLPSPRPHHYPSGKEISHLVWREARQDMTAPRDKETGRGGEHTPVHTSPSFHLFLTV